MLSGSFSTRITKDKRDEYFFIKKDLGSQSFPKFSSLGSFDLLLSLTPKPNLSQIECVSPPGFQVVNHYPVRKIWCSIFSVSSFYVALPSNRSVKTFSASSPFF